MQRLLLACCAVSVVAPLVHADPVFYTSRPSFLADARIGAVANVDFDGFAPGADLTSQSLSGARLTAPGSGPLLVTLGSVGVRSPMSPSSGLNVLSPGGSNPGLEDDDLTITFLSGVNAFGLDVVFDAPDGASFVGVTFRDAAGGVIFQNGFIPAPNGAPGYQFIGLVTDGPAIFSITFDEFDPTAADDNVAYDSLVFTPTPGATAILLLATVVITRRRR